MAQKTLLTRCPHCDTRFRVTDEQLGIAKGKVRCGNCMEVFNAREHAEPGQTRVPETPASPAPESFSAGPAEDPDDDLVFQDDPETDATEGHYAGSRLTFSEEELSDSFRSFDEKEPQTFTEDQAESDEAVDESWAEAMLQDDGSDRTDRESSYRAISNDPDNDAESAPARDDSSRKPEEPAFPAEPAEDAAEAEQPETAEQPAPSEPPVDQPVAPDDDFRADPRETPATARTSRATYDDLGRDPIAVGSGRGGSWLRRTVWSLLVIALLAGLVSQLVYFQFDRLSAIPELRPYYEQGCEFAGCELEPLIDLSQIQSRKLVVRTDPEDRSALIVDAEIVNRADFDQPFPSLALTFSNLNGDVVAQSLFEPDDYLAGDITDSNAMPSGTPVRIAIRIRDPGRDAVNYNIAFQRREP